MTILYIMVGALLFVCFGVYVGNRIADVIIDRLDKKLYDSLPQKYKEYEDDKG